jgi:hypothetical protein
VNSFERLTIAKDAYHWVRAEAARLDETRRSIGMNKTAQKVCSFECEALETPSSPVLPGGLEIISAISSWITNFRGTCRAMAQVGRRSLLAVK